MLRPAATGLAEAWRVLVTAEREQVESLPNRPRPEDFYGPISDAFRADPHRTDEELLDRLRAFVRPDETWVDVGAGGGRYALPIALLAKRVYAVEPSAGMRQTLVESAREHGIDNIEVFDERWPGQSTAPMADVSFISHVGYDIADIGPFLDEMEAHTRRMCVAVLFEASPIADFAALWRQVHGEDRVVLPGMRELTALLFARGSFPQLSLMKLPPRLYESKEALLRAVRRPLWVLEGTPEDERLQKAVQEIAVDVDGGVALRPQPRCLGIATWEPVRH
jgi:precorrin-6B methylase 2